MTSNNDFKKLKKKRLESSQMSHKNEMDLLRKISKYDDILMTYY